MVKRFLRILNLLLVSILSEHLTRKTLKRVPEPEIMDNLESVKSFHTQGEKGGYLIPIYHFNAVAMSYLIPPNGNVLDLGCGSAQYLIYLANYRPDIQIIGIDISEKMISLGREIIKNHGLENRIKLIIGDMTELENLVSEKVNLISSIFSLHHLPSTDHLKKCICQINKIHEKFKCGVWIFDHSRPRLYQTAFLFPEVFTPDAPEYFKKDSRNSILAAFSFEEMKECIDLYFSDKKVFHCCSAIMNLYQIHWIYPEEHNPFLTSQPSNINKLRLKGEELRRYMSLKALFRSDPLIKIID